VFKAFINVSVNPVSNDTEHNEIDNSAA